ncbi:UDP-glucose/GDP-mannose dehydrogenase family protein [Candidatus Bathyarchaeota archaeon]|nr:UDP-glucose/GDP-mannose dehydrogenase family protein [Candidatus Bathyarchaeota archaeon]
MSLRRVSFFGLGYVGLCTAVCFAKKGFKVVGVDIDEEKIKGIMEGEAPLYEPDLEPLLRDCLRKGTLTCTTDPREGVTRSTVSFITVGTPSRPDGSIDLRYIRLVAKDIGEALREKAGYHLVVVKSTVTPGTTLDVAKPILEDASGRKCGPDLGLCMNPEFLREGRAIQDVLNPDRIIIGEYDEKSGDLLEGLYRQFHEGETPPVLRTNIPTAELVKYANNAFLATKISFINTIANICERIPDVDVTTVARGIGLDHRINPRFLRAGLGYGGSCFPKDLKAIIALSKQLSYRPILLQAVQEVNEAQARRAVEIAREELGELKGKRIAVLGLSFKPDTDDMREARSIPIINQLLREGAEVTAYDPVAIPKAKTILKDRIRYAPSPTECLKGADCCILITEWEEFKGLRPEDFLKNMKQPILIDGRRIYNPKEFNKKLKFRAIGLGRRFHLISI